MCGFLGELSNQLSSVDDFKKLLDLSIHRGPDQQGFWRNNVCQLGFNRLSIIDTSANGNQPIISPSGRYSLVFNGEVYNYKEIQKKYSINDSDLRSDSDSEILAHLVDKISIKEFAAELNGMFAIAIFDSKNNRVHLLRDFAGIKPLFYGLHPNGIVFASQFDQIFSHSFFQNKKLRPEIMKEYFGLGYMQSPNTVFENIYQVNPGEIVQWDLTIKTIISKSNYYYWKTNPIYLETAEETVVKFSDVFSNVIENQLFADVPVACFLSGGIDSPLVTAFSKIHKSDIKAFTFGVNDKTFDESEIAKMIAIELNVNQVIEKVENDEFITVIDKHFSFFSEPFGDYSSIPTFLITKRAKKFATVMLSGDGGDELFWGYPRFTKSINHFKWFAFPLFFRKIIFPFYRKFYPRTSSAIDKIDKFETWILNKQIHFPNLDQLMPGVSFSKDLISTYRFPNTSNKVDALAYLKQNEFYAHMQKVLRKVDLMSMANSLEVRVPFLDKRVINFSNLILPELGIKHKKEKYILKNTLRNFVKEEITNLPKKGFSIPIDTILRNELKEDVVKTLLNDNFYGEYYIEKEVLNNVVIDYLDKNKGNGWGIWHLYAWQKWAKKYDLR
jgi:asparagine synthase (glutamine-hydrolysing)